MSDHERIFAGQILRSGGSVLHETVLEPRHFTNDTARRVFTAAQSVVSQGYEVDTFTVRDADTKLQASTVTELYTQAPTTANWAYYEKQILQSWRRREIQRIGEEMAAAPDPDTAIRQAEQALSEVQREGASDRVRHRSETVQETVDTIESAYYREGALPGVPTGYPKLDNLILGWQKRRLYLVGGRPSDGKSGLALNLYDYVAMREGVTAGLISLESGVDELNLRSFSNHANIESQKLATGYLRPADFKNLTDAAGSIYSAPAYVYDVPNQRLDRVVSVCRQMVRQFGVRIIFVDYLQLIRVPTADNMTEQVQTVSTELKAVSRMLDIPIVALAQLGRQVDRNGKEKRPGLADFQHSSRIEQDADAAILLHPTGERDYTQNVEAIVAKNRDGQTGTVNLVFAKPYVRFTEEETTYGTTT